MFTIKTVSILDDGIVEQFGKEIRDQIETMDEFMPLRTCNVYPVLRSGSTVGFIIVGYDIENEEKLNPQEE